MERLIYENENINMKIKKVVLFVKNVRSISNIVYVIQPKRSFSEPIFRPSSYTSTLTSSFYVEILHSFRLNPSPSSTECDTIFETGVF